MKNTIQYVLLCFCAFSLLTLNSCKEEAGCTDPLSINYDAQAIEDDGSCKRPQMAFNFAPTVRSINMDTISTDTTYLPFIPGNTYKINDLDVRIDLLTFYVTAPTLTGTEEYTLDKVGLFKSYVNRDTTGAITETITETSVDLGEVQAGDLTNVLFNVGVTSDLNNADPSLLPAESPLSADSPDIQHWNWTAGYIFLKVEGFVDVNQDGVFEQSNTTEYMSIHCGFNDNLAPVSIGVTKSVNDIDYRLGVNFDIAQFFNGYDLANQLFSRPDANPEYATQLMANVPAAFTIE